MPDLDLSEEEFKPHWSLMIRPIPISTNIGGGNAQNDQHTNIHRGRTLKRIVM